MTPQLVSVMAAMDQFVESHQRIHHQLLMTFLRRREYRVYRKKGSTKMCIAKTKEFVHYHPLKTCLPKEISHDDLLVSENTTSRLQASHREVFWREFGFTL